MTTPGRGAWEGQSKRQIEYSNCGQEFEDREDRPLTIHDPQDQNEANLHYKWQSHLATCFGCRQSRCKVWNSPNQTHWNLVHLPHLGPHLRSGKLSFWIITIFSHCRTNLDLARGVYCCAMFGDCDTFLPRHFLPTNHPWQSFGLTFISFFQFFILTTHNTQNTHTGRCNL